MYADLKQCNVEARFLTCDCDDSSCILQDRKKYNTFMLNASATAEYKKDEFFSGYAIGVNAVYSKNTAPAIFDSKCYLFRQGIQKFYDIIRVKEINRTNMELYTKEMSISKLVQKSVEIQDKKMARLQSLNQTLLDELRKNRIDYKEQKHKNNELKRENKKLKIMICRKTPDSNSDSDSETDLEVPSIETPRKISAIVVYQQLKNYMCEWNLSLHAIISRNSKSYNSILNTFLTLKWKRIEAAHPVVDEIANDAEFFKVLETMIP